MEIKGIQEGLTTFGNAMKDGVFWLGRHIKIGFEKLVPVLKQLASVSLKFLRTPAGLSSLGFGLGTSLLMLANTKWLESDTDKIARIALKISAVAVYIATGVCIGYAISTGNALLL